MPPPSEPDAYLRARIDRFYAELQVPGQHPVTSPVTCPILPQGFSWVNVGTLCHSAVVWTRTVFCGRQAGVPFSRCDVRNIPELCSGPHGGGLVPRGLQPMSSFRCF